jgi:hypothetical protein
MIEGSNSIEDTFFWLLLLCNFWFYSTATSLNMEIYCLIEDNLMRE